LQLYNMGFLFKIVFLDFGIFCCLWDFSCESICITMECSLTKLVVFCYLWDFSCESICITLECSLTKIIVFH
jgi:hypothetical protein